MSDSSCEESSPFGFSVAASEFVPAQVFRPAKTVKQRDTVREEARLELKKLKQQRYQTGERGEIHLADIVLSQLAVRLTQGYSKPDPYAIDRQQRHIVKPNTGKSKVVKTRIIMDNEVVTAVTPTQRIEAGSADVVKAPKKPTKLKQRIIEERKANPQTEVYIREYVTHPITSEVKACAISMLSSLRMFYDRLKDNPIKAKTHRRYKQGFRETLKAIDRG